MSQIPETSSNAAQIEYWNTTAAETWARFQETLDRQVELLGRAAMDALCREKASILSTSAAGV